MTIGNTFAHGTLVHVVHGCKNFPPFSLMPLMMIITQYGIWWIYDTLWSKWVNYEMKLEILPSISFSTCKIFATCVLK
jgi:hypothetical protein